jgi:hypothetical protein
MDFGSDERDLFKLMLGYGARPNIVERSGSTVLSQFIISSITRIEEGDMEANLKIIRQIYKVLVDNGAVMIPHDTTMWDHFLSLIKYISSQK